jgi:hypothetical protein
MTTLFIQNPEWTVYETGHNTDPKKGLRVGHPVAHYTDYQLMLEHWLAEFMAGTHNFFVAELEA